MAKIELGRDTLYDLYWKRELTREEVARQCNTTLKIVRTLFKQFGIPVRSDHEALVLSYKNNPERKAKIGNTLRGRHIKGHPAWNRGIPCTDHVKEALSEFRKGKPSPFKGKQHSQEAKQKDSNAHKGLPPPRKGIPWPPQMKRKFSENARRQWSLLSDGQREENRRRKTALWKDPEYVIKQIRARGVRPNKPEQSLSSILSKEFPDYQYNGDGRLGIVLAGLVPDFVNVNGRKQVIEVFGRYWHQIRKTKWHQTELGRIMAYNSIGWDCMILWEDELKDKEAVISKIKKFSCRKLSHVK